MPVVACRAGSGLGQGLRSWTAFRRVVLMFPQPRWDDLASDDVSSFLVKLRRRGLALALVRDLRDHRAPVSEEDLADFETGVLAGFVLARASAGLADSTIRNDAGHLELIRAWFGRPLWEMQPGDADAYFGKGAA